MVEHWSDPISQDIWEALPQCTEHRIWNWGALVPPLMVTAFGPWGVVASTGEKVVALVPARVLETR